MDLGAAGDYVDVDAVAAAVAAYVPREGTMLHSLSRNLVEMRHIREWLAWSEATLLANESAVLLAQEVAWYLLGCIICAAILQTLSDVIHSFLASCSHDVAFTQTYDIDIADTPAAFTTAVAFYTNALGYTLQRDASPDTVLLSAPADAPDGKEPPSVYIHAAIVQSRATLLKHYPELTPYVSGKAKQRRIRYQTVADVDAAAARLEDAGVTVVANGKNAATGVREVWYVDAAGCVAGFAEQ